MKRREKIKIITGGIGSGKSYVCRLLEKRGVKVYDCDSHAKALMVTDKDIREGLTKLIGNGAYKGRVLNKAEIARFLLECPENNKAINEVVHPAVIRDFLHSDCEWMESAIFYDANVGGLLEKEGVEYVVVCVVAPLETRVERVMLRDGITKEKALEWIEQQTQQEEKAERSDYVILNDGRSDVELEKQITCLLSEIQRR